MFTYLITHDLNIDFFIKVGSARLLRYRIRQINKYLEEDATHF